LAALSIDEQARRVRDSGLFDADWDLAANPDVMVSGADPLDHFMMFWAAEGRDPNNYFKTAAYCRAFPELVRSTQNPLPHFSERHPRVPPPDLSTLRDIAPRGSVAVVLHLFEPDLWQEMHDAIARIPVSFDLFVSVTHGFSTHMRPVILRAFPHAY